MFSSHRHGQIFASRSLSDTQRMREDLLLQYYVSRSAAAPTQRPHIRHISGVAHGARQTAQCMQQSHTSLLSFTFLCYGSRPCGAATKWWQRRFTEWNSCGSASNSDTGISSSSDTMFSVLPGLRGRRNDTLGITRTVRTHVKQRQRSSSKLRAANTSTAGSAANTVR